MFAAASTWAQPVPLRIMPVGDSITYGIPVAGGYRAPLYRLLTNGGYNVDFVGTQTGNGTPSLPDPDHEGYSGWRIRDIDSIILNVLNAVPAPDIILLLIGTNDYGGNDDPGHATNRLEALIVKMANTRPNARIIVANLLARGEPYDTQIRTTFNPLLPGICERQRALGRQVFFNDLRSAVPLSDMPDNLHPNQLGYNKMATNWFAAIQAILRAETGPYAIAAEADAYVRDGTFSSTNFGSASLLAVANGLATYHSYLRFPLTNVFGPVLDARLRLVPAGGESGMTNALALVSDNGWAEGALTWDNQPASGAILATWTITGAAPVEIPLAEAVRSTLTAADRISFRVFAPDSAPLFSYASREQPALYAPRLVVITSNTPPMISTIPDQTIAKNGSVTLPFTIGDAEKPVQMLALSAVSSNLNLVPRPNITIAGTGAQRTLTLVARSNQLGTTIIAVTVSDGFLSDTTTFHLTVEGSNNPPNGVLITSPVGNSVFPAPASIPLAAIVADPNGNVERVNYFLGNAIIASTTPPFSYLWTNVPPGTYSLRAVATDGGGLSVTSSLRQVVVENTVTLVPDGAIWKYYDVNGVDLGTGWRGTNYNDTSWPSGPASLGYGDPAVTTVDSTPSRITTYFRHQFMVSNPSSITNLTLFLMRDDGAVVYLNSNEVFRSNMPGGTIVNSTLALSAISGAEETTWYTNRFATGPLLRPGANVLAVEVHQGSTDSSDLGFNLMLVGHAAGGPVNPATLNLRRDSSFLVFSWPANDGWNLYSTPTLGSATVWTKVTGVTPAGGEMNYVAPSTQPSRFFQLRRP
jgi:lysophospholipase L1-like esterase